MKASKRKPAPAGTPKARKLSRIYRPGRHWYEWAVEPGSEDTLEEGFAWRSDVMYGQMPHLDICESKDGRMFLLCQEYGRLVCEVTGEEAWNYISTRYLPPVLRKRCGKSFVNALAGLDGCADLTETEVELLRQVSAWNGSTVREYVSQILRAMVQEDVGDLYGAVVRAADPKPEDVDYWRRVEPLALEAGLHPFPNGWPVPASAPEATASADRQAVSAPAAKPRRRTKPASRPKA